MEDYLYGRYTQMERLDAIRHDYSKRRSVRADAHYAFVEIQRQLKDRRLMRLRERLIKATRAADYHESWKIENAIRAYEKRYSSEEDEA